MTTKTYYISARGKVLGRLASEVAHMLQGKHLPDWQKHRVPAQKVVVYEAAKVRVTGRKMTDKIYWRATNRPGSLRGESLGDLLARRPEEVLRRAVYGMLPANKLRKVMLRQLKIYAGELPAREKTGEGEQKGDGG